MEPAKTAFGSKLDPLIEEARDRARRRRRWYALLVLAAAAVVAALYLWLGRGDSSSGSLAAREGSGTAQAPTAVIDRKNPLRANSICASIKPGVIGETEARGFVFSQLLYQQGNKVNEEQDLVERLTSSVMAYCASRPHAALGPVSERILRPYQTRPWMR
jgi:hypothetical protein